MLIGHLAVADACRHARRSCTYPVCGTISPGLNLRDSWAFMGRVPIVSGPAWERPIDPVSLFPMRQDGAPPPPAGPRAILRTPPAAGKLSSVQVRNLTSATSSGRTQCTRLGLHGGDAPPLPCRAIPA
jgi:hypothetical protein